MATPTRLANKTQWALDDILRATKEAQPAWQAVYTIAKARMDPALLAGLAEIRDFMAFVERKARLARAGDYDEYDEKRRIEEANCWGGSAQHSG
jgi:hypothetical protein